MRKKINIFSINNGAIGHYPINIFLSIKMFGKDKVVFFFKKGIKGSNEYLNNKLKEEFNFNDKYERIYKFIDVLNFLTFKKLKINQMPNVSHMGKNNNFSSLFEKPSKIFEFNLNENNIGNEYLKRINTEENKFVCLLIRNDEYYKSIGITGSNLERMKFRNVDPKNYINSIEYLIEKGFHVIRMGKNHQTNFPFKHEKFIDYAISKDRSDFLDIWLTAKCYFFLSSSTGLGSLPLLFNKPYIFTNHSTVGRPQSWAPKSIHVPLMFKKGEKLLNIRDLLSLNIIARLDGIYLKKNKVEVIENDSEDILMSVKDMLFKIQNGFKISNLNLVFWEKLRNEWNSKRMHDWSPSMNFDHFHKINYINTYIPDYYLKKYNKIFLDY